MKKIYSITLIFLGIVLIASSALSQSIKIKSIRGKYPNMIAEVIYIDAAGNEKKLPTDFLDSAILKDSGKGKKIIKVVCEEVTPSFTLIMTIDQTGSMTLEDITDQNGVPMARWKAARSAARMIIEQNPSREECGMAITSFASQSLDKLFDFKQISFSSDEKLLKQAVDRIDYSGPTNHNRGYLGPDGGCLYMAEKAIKNGMCPPAVIFLTDGEHDVNFGPLDVTAITNEAIRLNVPIFNVTLGLPMPPELETISTASGGAAYAEQASEAGLIDIFTKILQKVKDLMKPKGCEVYWIAECDGGNVTIEYKGLTATATYTIPDEVKPALVLTPDKIEFLNLGVNNFIDTAVKITAKKNFVVFNDAGSTPLSNFKVIDWGGHNIAKDTLYKDSSWTIKVRYTSPDSLRHRDSLHFLSTACSFKPLVAENAYIKLHYVDMGSGPLGQKKPGTHPIVTNATYRDIKIENNITFGNPNASEFTGTNLAGSTVAAGTIKNGDFTFTPADNGTRSSLMSLKVDGKIYTDRFIFGVGSGQPDLKVTEPQGDWAKTNCKLTQVDSDVILENTGAVKLEVSSVTFNPSGNFSLVNSGDAGPFSIDPGKTRTIPIRFSSSTPGTYTAVMTIANNGASGDKTVNLTGITEKADHIILTSPLYFDPQCPGADTVMFMDVRVTEGDFDRNFKVEVAPPFYVGETPNFTWRKGSQKGIRIEFRPTAVGVYREKVRVIDQDCNIIKELDVSGECEIPNISAAPIQAIATLGDSQTVKVTITLNSKRSASVTAVPGDPSLRISPQNFNMLPGETRVIDVTFIPEDVNPVNSFVRFTPIPCGVSNDIAFTGATEKATATIEALDASDYYGAPVNLNLILKDQVKVIESKATSINTKVSFDSRLLTPASMTGVTQVGNNWVVELKTLPILNNLATLPVIVQNTSALTSTPIAVSESRGVGGVIEFKEIAGVFTALNSSATISAGSAKQEPGGEVTIPIFIENLAGVEKFHESIQGNLVYNASLLQPINGTSAGTFANFERTVPFSFSIADKNLTGKVKIGDLTFRAMLGNVEKTDLKLTEPKSVKGNINFDIINGEFSLNGVCNDGTGLRLFNPWGSALALSANPNPAQDKITIDYSVRDNGSVKMWLGTALGAKVKDILNGQTAKGVHSLQLETSELPQGIYILHLETELGSKNLLINIVK